MSDPSCKQRKEEEKFMNFEELCLDPRIFRAVTEMGFEQASPIQAKAIPVALEGRDIIGQAQNGLRLLAYPCCSG